MENRIFVVDNFDNFKTLLRKEKSLLGDMRVAFMDKDVKKFRELLHRTGYKNNLYQDNVISTYSFLFCLGLKTFRTSRNLLFEHDMDRESLFEEILKRQGNSKFISLIWTECELWRKQDILVQYNSNGMQPIDYIIQSNSDENLFAFLVYDFEQESETATKASKNYFLKLKNTQYTQKTGSSLFQKIYKIINSKCEKICYDILKIMLTEMEQIVDIKREVDVDTVISMQNDMIKHNILKIIMPFWKIYSKEYIYYKAALRKLSPYFALFFSLKEKQESIFEKLFADYISTMKSNHDHETYLKIVRDDCNSLLQFALRNDQRHAINIIISCSIIDPNKVVINADESTFDNQKAQFIMSKLLESGYFMGNVNDGKRVPIDWINPQVFEDFLDSRVKEDGIHGCQIDYSFLINPDVLNEKPKGDFDENGMLLFSRGVKSLENIMENDNLKTFITHPVLSTFINLKVRKYRFIFNLNFFIFIFFYMIPFYFLLTLIPFTRFYIDIFEDYGELFIIKKRKVYKLFGLTRAEFFHLPYYACFIATIYLTLRESLQLFAVSNSIKDYIKKRSNQFEIVVISLSWLILYGLKKFTASEIRSFMTIPSAFIIIFATVELLTILPYPSMSIYMFMLKQVTKTFIKFFTIFILIIIAFTFSFCIVLKPPTNKTISPWHQLKNNWNNYSATTNSTAFNIFKDPAVMFIDTLEDALEDNETIFRNFDNPFTSFQKTLLMLSGEYTIEPYTLDSIPKQLLFLFFIFTSFILFNLINGLAISDIQQLKKHAEYLNLKQQIRNASESEGVLCDIYWKVCQKSKKKSFLRECIMFLMSLLVRKYPYLHKIDNLCIDFKTKAVKYELDHRRTHILRTYNGDTRKYFLDERTVKKLRVILEKRHNVEENLNEKFECLHDEVKKLKHSLRNQHDEIKKLMEEILQKKS